MIYDILLFPRKTCNVCGNELEIKMNVEQRAECIKFYHICKKCETTSCDTLKFIGKSKEEYKTSATLTE